MVVININKDFHTVTGYANINSQKNLLTPSMEDYLEMIYRCSLEENYVRLNKIAQMLNVRDSSASKMMKKLGDLSLIKYEKYGVILLTEKGRKVGEYLLNRHNILETFLTYLGNNDKILIETELIEHVISAKTVQNLALLNMFFESNPDILVKYREFKEKSFKK